MSWTVVKFASLSISVNAFSCFSHINQRCAKVWEGWQFIVLKKINANCPSETQCNYKAQNVSGRHRHHLVIRDWKPEPLLGILNTYWCYIGDKMNWHSHWTWNIILVLFDFSILLQNYFCLFFTFRSECVIEIFQLLRGAIKLKEVSTIFFLAIISCIAKVE